MPFKLKRWYWALLALWACTFLAVLVWLGWGALDYVLMALLSHQPLIGWPALLLALSPLLVLPLAVRRTKFLAE